MFPEVVVAAMATLRTRRIRIRRQETTLSQQSTEMRLRLIKPADCLVTRPQAKLASANVAAVET